MKPIDLLEQLRAGQGRTAFVATYEFDPAFFEMQILRNTMLENCERVVVFVDRARYREILRGGFIGPGFNRQYLVIPISRKPGAFHPKLYLVMAERSIEGMIGSNNCTAAGFAHNLELISGFSTAVAGDESPDSVNHVVLGQIYQCIRRAVAADHELRDVLDREFFLPAEEDHPWLSNPRSDKNSDVSVLHSYDRPLWEQIKGRLAGKAIERITIAAPFFDQDLALIKRLRRTWPKVRLTLIAQPDYATLNGKGLAKIFRDGPAKLLAATPKPGRRLHAKAFAFETRRETYWLSGSPNASLAAFDGTNLEVALWINSKERPKEIFESAEMDLQEIEPAEFVAGSSNTVGREESSASDLRVESAVIERDGHLRCSFSVIGSLRGTRLVLKNQAEELPVFSFDIVSRAAFEVILSEQQRSELRGSVLCELLRGHGKDAERSDPVSVIQLFQILRERGQSKGSRNPLRRIEETGENLMEHVDGLGSLREVIEFFDNCNIRFNDGEGEGPFNPRNERWRPRKPLKPDTPPGWTLDISGAQAAEMRAAILDFVNRHQNQKLEKHIRRGNINGIGNFLDIFRTLNSVLLTYHRRQIAGELVIPASQVTGQMTRNLSMLIGPMEVSTIEESGDGFVASILENQDGEPSLLAERLELEGVPQMLRAAIHAMIDVRASARNIRKIDAWATSRINWVSNWLTDFGLRNPTSDEIASAELEYQPARGVGGTKSNALLSSLSTM